MTTLDALLAAVIADPADDAVRFIWADAAEEAGEGERAEFVRVQMAFEDARHCPCDPSGRTPGGTDCLCRFCSLRRLEGQLFRTEWLPLFTGELREWYFGDFPAGYISNRQFSYLVRRGFVEAAVCRLASWLSHGSAIVAAHPIMTVRLTDKQPMNIGNPTSTPGDDPWRVWFTWGDARLDIAPEASDGEFESDLPHELFVRLKGGQRLPHYPFVVYYPSEAEAIDDASAACLSYARREAGLPAAR